MTWACPKCFEDVFVSTAPTERETRSAVKRGNRRAIADEEFEQHLVASGLLKP